MDTLTHIVLGACTGEAILGNRIGKKALLVGAFANTLPDCDVLSSLWLDTDSSLLAHRGFTHSLLFMLAAAIFLAFLFRRWNMTAIISFKSWVFFFAFELFLHIFIDAFNAYGTGWFEPFSHYRVSFYTIFVVDPFYTIWLLIAFIALLILGSGNESRKGWTRFGLAISSLYFMYCVVNKVKADVDIRDALEKQSISYESYLTTPAPFNNWLWYIVAGNDSGYYIGYYSVFDRNKQIDLHYFRKNDSLLDPFRKQDDVQHLVRFSKGFYTIDRWDNAFVFNDLRFGQMVGWYDPNEKFVFHYFLQRREENKLVVQRGRFAKWNVGVVKSLIRRIQGN